MTDTNVDALLSPVLDLQELLSDILQLGGDFAAWNGSRHQRVLHRLADGMGSVRHPGQCDWAFGKGNFGGISDLL